jgi:hypothetical protein
MICRSDKNAVIRLNYDAMNTNNAVSQPRIRERSRTFRSLFGAVAGALMLTAALVPRANATVVVYFNFEDGTLGSNPQDPGIVDTAADVIGAPDFNPGGGIQNSTLIITNTTGPGDIFDTTGLTLNRTVGDIDTAVPGQALSFHRTAANQGASVCFIANTTFLTDLSLSFAINNAGNGFTNVDLTINGISTTGGVGQTILNTSAQLFTFNSANSTINNAALDGNVEFCLVFTGGQSNGANGQTIIDNIVLGGTVVPEPATVVGGLLGLCGLCWHQRRRLVRSLYLLRT